jgi:glutamyl-tRNA synthetase
MPLTRLAPSPTGSLHLGNARTFLANWLLARQRGWRVLLRIDDVDGPRLKSGADQSAIEDLAWLGLEWDDGPDYSSRRTKDHRAAAERLLAAGVAYPDVRTRSDIDADAKGRRAADGATLDPGPVQRFATLAEAKASNDGEAAARVAAPLGVARFTDGFCGEVAFDWQHDLGDFPLLKREGVASYQLATVVDDAAAGVTDVVRGHDLLASTPRQIHLYNMLGWGEQVPNYWHLPLVIGPDGRKLAKRHGDTRIAAYRSVGRGRVLRLLADWLAVPKSVEVRDPGDLLPHFELARVPREPIVFDPADAGAA